MLSREDEGPPEEDGEGAEIGMPDAGMHHRSQLWPPGSDTANSPSAVGRWLHPRHAAARAADKDVRFLLVLRKTCMA